MVMNLQFHPRRALTWRTKCIKARQLLPEIKQKLLFLLSVVFGQFKFPLHSTIGEPCYEKPKGPFLLFLSRKCFLSGTISVGQSSVWLSAALAPSDAKLCIDCSHWVNKVYISATKVTHLHSCIQALDLWQWWRETQWCALCLLDY